MQNLNKNTGEELPADEWNELISELNTLIQNYSQSLSASNLKQIATTLATAGSISNFYIETGTGSAYVLEAMSIGNGNAFTQELPVSLAEGMDFRFKADNTNTTTTPTLKVGAFTAYPIKLSNGEDLKIGSIESDNFYSVKFTGSEFLLQNSLGIDNYYIASGVNAISLTSYDNTPKAKEYYDGMEVRWRPAGSNTSTSTTINVDGLGVRDLKTSTSPGFIPDIEVGRMQPPAILSAAYDASTGRFILTSKLPTSNSGSTDSTQVVATTKAVKNVSDDIADHLADISEVIPAAAVGLRNTTSGQTLPSSGSQHAMLIEASLLDIVPYQKNLNVDVHINAGILLFVSVPTTFNIIGGSNNATSTFTAISVVAYQTNASNQVTATYVLDSNLKFIPTGSYYVKVEGRSSVDLNSNSSIGVGIKSTGSAGTYSVQVGANYCNVTIVSGDLEID